MNAVMLPETIHPDLWWGNQLANARTRVVDCGDVSLARELPGGGWPRGALTDLLVQHTGCGKLRLLRPAFEQLSTRPVARLQPPHDLQPTALAWWGLDPSNVMTFKAPRTADALGLRSRFCAQAHAVLCFTGRAIGAPIASGHTGVRVALFRVATACDDARRIPGAASACDPGRERRCRYPVHQTPQPRTR